MPARYCFRGSSSSGNGSPITISARKGDVYKAALPSGLKLESETIVEYNPDFESDVRLPEKEQKILDALSTDPEQCVTKLEKETGIKNILSVIKSLLDKEAIFVKEELRRTYKPKTETRVRLTAAALATNTACTSSSTSCSAVLPSNWTY